MSHKHKHPTTSETVLLLASEDTDDFPSYESIPNGPETNSEDSEPSLLSIPHLIPIEISLLSNVFLAMFDSTITASTYTLISSEFNAAHLGSWITTSYLITSTSFQPLYGSFSDILGRRACYFFATIVFTLGCIGCSLARDIYTLFIARAITGVGGGGLVTLATVVNSDIIPASKRGLFQGFQNILIGLGSILGASLGGFIAETVGWRFCFLGQVPISAVGLLFGYAFIKDQKELKKKNILNNIDLLGSLLLVSGLTGLLLALYTETILSYTLTVTSFAALYAFYRVESSTTRIPIIPFSQIKSVSNYLTLFISTLSGYAMMSYVFILPLLFQIILGDSPSTSGLRLGFPSIFTSVGSLMTAYYMNKSIDWLPTLYSTGISLVALGNLLALFISRTFSDWLINLLLIPANTGLGLCNPALLFTFVFAFPKNLQASSTSTLYLFRAIGMVFGVAFTSSMILRTLRYQLFKNFEGLDLDRTQVDEIISRSIRSISYIKTLPEDIRGVVTHSYEASIRGAQALSTAICAIAIILCFVKRKLEKSKEITYID